MKEEGVLDILEKLLKYLHHDDGCHYLHFFDEDCDCGLQALLNKLTKEAQS